MTHERDLLLAPGFFLALAQQQPAITHVEVWPKRGRFHNQLTRFRYEAVLHIGDAVEPRRDLTWLDWQRQKLTIAEVRRRLSETRPETLAIRNIPNARLDEEVAALDWLREAGPAETIAQLRAYLVDEVGEDWWRSAKTGELLRSLFAEGTRPSSEEIAGRLGFEPYDTAPLSSELSH